MRPTRSKASQLLRGTGNAPEALWSGLNSTGRELVMVGMDVLTGRAPPTIAQIAFFSVHPDKASGWDPQSDGLQWLFSGKLKEVKPGEAAEAVASIVPVHQLMTFMGNAGAADPNLNQQAGTALGIALAGGIATKTVDWIPTKLGSAAKVEEVVAGQRHLGKAGEDVASSAGNTIATQGASGSMPSVMFGNAGNGAVDLATSRGTWGGLPASPAAQGFAEQLVRPGDMVPLPRGAMGLQDLGSLASSEGAEFAVIRLNGDRYIVRGTANTTTIPEGSTLIGHVHPGEGFMGLAPSVEDMSALGLLNQGRSAIFNESGAWRTFGPNGPSSSVFMPKPKTTPGS